jgi:hypothetical protein
MKLNSKQTRTVIKIPTHRTDLLTLPGAVITLLLKSVMTMPTTAMPINNTPLSNSLILHLSDVHAG